MQESVLLVANFDSGLKYASRLAAAFGGLGAAPALAAPTTVAPHSLGPDQIRASATLPVDFAEWDALVERAAAADVVVPVFDGPNVQRFIRDVHERGGERRPVFGAGYVGMALYDVVGGYLMRSLADVVAINSRTDLATFGAAGAALGLPTSNLELCGLALLPSTPLPQRGGPIRTVLFTDQPTVPRRPGHRAYVWDRLLQYARLHPDRTVLLRPRHRPDESTFHRMRFSPDAWAAGRDLPENLRIDHTPLTELLPAADLVLTVSSTAALEAIALGVRVALIADFVNDAALNPPLVPSGLLRTFDDIDLDRLGEPDPAWVDDLFPAANGEPPATRFASRALSLVGSADRPHDRMWGSGFHVGRRTTDATVERLAPVALGSRYTPRRVTAGVLRRALRVVER